MATAIAAPIGHAADAWKLLTRDGQELIVEPSGLGSNVVRWLGPDRVTERLPIDRVLQLSTDLPRWPEPDAFEAYAGRGSVLVDLVDGQRAIGRLASTDQPDSIAVRVGPVTVWTIPLERVSRLVVDPEWGDLDADATTRADDLVVLRNGDRLAGFVAGIDRARSPRPAAATESQPAFTVAIEPGADGAAGVVLFDLDRVRRIELSNPAEPMRGRRIDLRNGSIVLAGRLIPGATDLRSIIIEPAWALDQPEALLPVALRDVAGLTPDPQRVVPLASIEPRPPLSGGPWTPAAKIEPATRSIGGLAAIHLPGPIVMTWDIPRRARAFTAVAAPSPDAGPWTHAVLRVVAVGSSGSRTALAVRTVEAESSAERLWIELPETTTALEIELAEGERGPVQDRVTLSEAAFVRE